MTGIGGIHACESLNGPGWGWLRKVLNPDRHGSVPHEFNQAALLHHARDAIGREFSYGAPSQFHPIRRKV